MKIEEYLLKNNFNPSFRGFEFIVDAIELIRKDKNYKFNIVSMLYPKIAKDFDTTPSRVERGIRYAISQSKLKNKTNSLFLALAEIETR